MNRIERAAVVQAVDGAVVRLALAPACDNCGGCGGRCGLLGPLGGDSVELPQAQFDLTPRAGDAVRIYLPDAALLARARIGYGLPLLGLLAGAALGQLSGSALNAPADLLAVFGALAGTYAGVFASKRATLPPCRVAPGDAGDGVSLPIACNEDRLP
jgi:sigma-E factor negative regulatory protein RseC